MLTKKTQIFVLLVAFFFQCENYINLNKMQIFSDFWCTNLLRKFGGGGGGCSSFESLRVASLDIILF